MVKKFAALAAGVAMLSIGVMPVLANQGTSQTEVDVNNNMTLTVTQNGGEAPFGSTTTATDFTPTDPDVSQKFRETTKTTLVMTTNSIEGGEISAQGTVNDGVLTGGVGGTDSILNSMTPGDGVNLDATCLADQESTPAGDDFTGLATRVDNALTDAAFFYAGATTITAKYGDGTTAANRSWCHFDGVNRGVAETTSYNQASTDLVIDYLVGVKAGVQSVGLYNETITFTGIAN